jgi:seryl-tRNA synthetase
MIPSADFIRQVDEVDPKLKSLFLYFMNEIEVKTRVITLDRRDFNEMKDVLRRSVEVQVQTEQRMRELTEAQERTEQRVGELTEAQKRLAEAQERTEQRVGELTEAQKRTDARLERLAEAQERTEQRVGELTEAQERTEKSVRSLAENQKNMAVQLGGLSMAVGYGIEDKIMPDIRNFVLRQYGIEVLSVDRRNVMYPDGKYDEVNLYVEGVKDSRPVFLIGECKAQPGKKDFDRFDKMLHRLQEVLKGDIVPFIVGYHYAPEVEAYADLRHSRISRYKTFQISHPDLNKKVDVLVKS